jgi:hypothetical protein
MRLRRGQRIEIRFYDHYKHGTTATPLECIAWGLFERSTKKTIAINNWVVLDPDARTRQSNTERFVILKSTIQSIRRPVRWETLTV